MSAQDFVAVDVETANESPRSICQIGAAHFQGGQVVKTFSTLINPGEPFARMNVSIHGITEDQVKDAPTFAQVSDELHDLLRDRIVTSHGLFDRNAFRSACLQHKVEDMGQRWVDASMVARRAWRQFARKGYGLANLCQFIGYEGLEHHDALSDAIAAGHILLAALKEQGVSIQEWIRVTVPAIRVKPADCAPNPDGPFAGEVICFTGTLSVIRREAKAFAAAVGFENQKGMTLKTTVLVVGDQDILAHRGQAISNKMKKAEEMAARGLPIRVIGETDFFDMLNHL